MLTFCLSLLACGGDPPPVQTVRAPTPPADLAARCASVAPDPVVEAVADRVWVARGFDLANTVVIGTDDGLIVVDTSMSPARAEAVRAAVREVVDAPIAAVVFTHSHIDHVGGASVWVEPDTQVWASARLQERFFAQYGRMLPAESFRGVRQFGRHVPDAALPCSSLGRRVDLDAALQGGVVMPTHTIDGQATLSVGGRDLLLVEAYGETTDQLYGWLDDADVLLAGDNWYRAFPNVYTLRGTEPRPVDAWIGSLDAMRAHDPAVLVPSHSEPVTGTAAVRAALTNTRDGLQWVRDTVVRGANAGQSLEEVVAGAALPPHLAEVDALGEWYGQVDWSARAIYTNTLGWFDGQSLETLYPVPHDALAARLVERLGGAEAVTAEAREAIGSDPRWAIQLLAWLEAAGQTGLDGLHAEAYEALAADIGNTNGRGTLLQAAHERRNGVAPLGEPVLSPDFVAGIPLEEVFDVMASRLRPELAIEAHEAVVFVFPDVQRQVAVTVRRGVAEVRWGPPLPGTPAPVATVTVDSGTWRRLALQQESPAKALLSGRLKIAGDALSFQGFLDRFDRGLTGAPPPPP